MSLYTEHKKITQMFYGNKRLTALYKGNVLIFQVEPIVESDWDLYTLASNSTTISDKGKNNFSVSNTGTTITNSFKMLFNSSSLSISKNGVDLSSYNWKFETKLKFSSFDTQQTLIEKSGSTNEYKFTVKPKTSGKIQLKLQSGETVISHQFDYKKDKFNNISFKRLNKQTFIFIVNGVSYSQTNSNINCFFNSDNNTIIGSALNAKAEYFRILIKNQYQMSNQIFITSESSLDSSYSVVSQDVPAFHNIGMKGLGPFLFPTTISASGTLDDVFFVFDGEDPEVYRQVNPDTGNTYYNDGVGTYDVGTIYWTQPKCPATQPMIQRQEYVIQDLTKYGAIPANKKFSIFIVDTVIGQAMFDGKISFKMNTSAGTVITQDIMKISFTDYPEYDYASVVKTKNNKIVEIIYTCTKNQTPSFSFTLYEGYVYEVRYYKNQESF